MGRRGHCLRAAGKLGAALGSWGPIRAAWCKMRRVMAKKAGGHFGSQGPQKKAKKGRRLCGVADYELRVSVSHDY